ncbi:MAG: hypothetical protein Q9171_005892 [Xanthocarpia ochracea]
MTPQFYARYIPPSNSINVDTDGDELEKLHVAKKRRKQTDGAGNRTETAQNDQTGHEGLEMKVEKRESKHKSAKPDLTLSELAQNATNTKLVNRADAHLLPDDSSDKFAGVSLHEKSAVPQYSLEGKSSQSVGDGNQVQAAPLSVRPKKKKKKNRDQGDDAVANDCLPSEHSAAAAKAPATDHRKHIGILSKFEKSIKGASSATDNASSNTEPHVKEVTLPKTHGLVPLPQPAQVPDPTPPSVLSALPSWLTNPVEATSVDSLSFGNLSLNPTTAASLQAKGFDQAFAIQAAVLQLLLPGEKQHRGDLCIAASTGSGKTLAYALPMVEALRDKPVRRLRGLVVVPTRELVNQARETLELCSNNSRLKIGTAFGSKTLKEEQEALIGWGKRYDPDAYRQEQTREMDEDERLLDWDEDRLDTSSTGEQLVDYVDDYYSNVDILICTPGRLIEHLEHTRGFTLDHVQWLVIDEADRLLGDGFQQWVSTVIPALDHQNPPNSMESLMMQKFHLLRKREVRKIILSATMTRDVSKLKELHLRRPKLVMLQSDRRLKQDPAAIDDVAVDNRVGGASVLPSTLHEIAIQIKDEENKPLYLIELLKGSLSIPSHGLKTEVRNLTREISVDSDNDISNESSEFSDHDSIPDRSSSSGSSLTNSDSDSDSGSDISMADYQSSHPAEKLRGSLIFAHSTSSAHRLSRLISLLAPQQASMAATLTKSSTQSSERILTQFRNGKLDTIITTDRASRGLDIQNLAYVINYDMPSSVTDYVHRVGRTARAGKAGTAITLVGWRQGRWFWNQVGRGQGIQRGNKRILRKNLKEEGWDDDEKAQYANALRRLGQETSAERNG